METGRRFRIFFIAIVVSLWLFITDAINPLANLDFDTLDEQQWTYYLLIVSGLFMGIFGGISAIMVLFWVNARIGGLMMSAGVLLASLLRIIAVTVGFQNFSGGVKQSHTYTYTFEFAVITATKY